jgi:hypothetical protein
MLQVFSNLLGNAVEAFLVMAGSQPYASAGLSGQVNFSSTVDFRDKSLIRNSGEPAFRQPDVNRLLGQLVLVN